MDGSRAGELEQRLTRLPACLLLTVVVALAPRTVTIIALVPRSDKFTLCRYSSSGCCVCGACSGSSRGVSFQPMIETKAY